LFSTPLQSIELDGADKAIYAMVKVKM